MKAQKSLDLSLILPVYNEEENIIPLCEEILGVMKNLSLSFEMLLVDDGSHDRTPAVLEKLSQQYPQIKVVQFTRNYGQTAAIAAGFEHATGLVYIALDADGQNDPASIPDLLNKLNEGYDVVSGIRAKRKDNFLMRKLPSLLANTLISKMTGVKLKDYGCTLKAYRAEYIDNVSLYGEMHRFIPALAKMAGAKITEIPVKHRARLHGQSKYGLGRIFKVLIDLITVKFLGSFATKPNYLFGGLGTIFCLTGIFCGSFVLFEKFWFGIFAHRNPLLLLAVFLFILGVQCFMMGLIAELLVRTYYEAQDKKIYLVKKLINFGSVETKVRSII